MATYKLIVSNVLASNVSGVVTLNTIDQSYDDLVIYTSCRASNGTGNTGTDINISVNGSGTWTGQTGYAYSTTLGADTGANRIGMISASDSEAGSFAFGKAYLTNYSSATTNKQFLMVSGYAHTGSYFSQDETYGRWSGADAINTITFTSGYGNFGTGSIFTLYGIKRS